MRTRASSQVAWLAPPKAEALSLSEAERHHAVGADLARQAVARQSAGESGGAWRAAKPMAEAALLTSGERVPSPRRHALQQQLAARAPQGFATGPLLLLA